MFYRDPPGSPASNSLPEVAVGPRLLRDLKLADAVGQDQRGESVLTGSVSRSGSEWESALERL